MKNTVLSTLLAILAFPTSVFACSDSEYEACYSFCAVPRLYGGCAQEVKDCKCLPKAHAPIPDVQREAEKVTRGTMTIVKVAAGDTVVTLTKAGGDVIRTVEKAGNDAVQTVVKAGSDACVFFFLAWKDTGEQARRSFNDAVEAGIATVHYEENQVKVQERTLSNAAKRLREGKMIDSMWGLAVEPLQGAEANFAKATQESKVIAGAAATAAATYGGPAGAAAYAAWATYKTTGDAEMALRAGLLAAATAQAGTQVSSMPTGTTGEVLKIAALAGAAGGIAVSATNRDEEAIKEGFLKSGGTVLIQYGKYTAKGYSPKAKDAWDTIQCVSARDVDCISKTTWARDLQGKILNDANGRPRIDTTMFDPEKNKGKWTAVDPNSVEGRIDKVVTKISQLPQMDAIPLMKNKWVLTWNIGQSANIEYGKPTVVLTYVGSDPPFTSKAIYGDHSDKTAPAIRSRDRADTMYECTAGGMNRTITVSLKNKGCISIYRRANGTQQIVWNSEHFPQVCESKTRTFLKQLAMKGVSCHAR